MNRPDLTTIAQNSYACGLPRHSKETRMLVQYIEYLEGQLSTINDKEKSNDAI
jgi:hypothetical protein